MICSIEYRVLYVCDCPQYMSYLSSVMRSQKIFSLQKNIRPVFYVYEENLSRNIM